MTEQKLTNSEKKKVRALVTTKCGNYGEQYACTLIYNDCHMLVKDWTGSFCGKFRREHGAKPTQGDIV
jgi:hypothetical protein